MMTLTSWQEAVIDLEVLESPDEKNDLTPAVTVLGEAGSKFSSPVSCVLHDFKLPYLGHFRKLFASVFRLFQN